MALVAYGRVSTTDQKNSIATQRGRFIDLGVDPDLIFLEMKSGKAAANRPKLQEMLRTVRKGDTLVVTKIDRLARSLDDLREIVKKVTVKGAHFKALDQSGVDTTSPGGRAMLGMLAVFAEFERDLITERRLEGVEKARARGQKFGRPPKMTEKILGLIRADRDAGKPVAQIVKERKLSRSSVFRAIARTI